MRRIEWFCLVGAVLFLATAAMIPTLQQMGSSTPVQLPLGTAQALDPIEPPVPNAQVWQSALCFPAPEQAPTGTSDFTVTGACAFHQTGAFLCHSDTDDFTAVLERRLLDDRILSLFISIEGYRGAGNYGNVPVLLQVTDGTNYYRWSAFLGSVAVGSGATSATLAPAELQAEVGSGSTGTVTVGGRISCAVP